MPQTEEPTMLTWSILRSILQGEGHPGSLNRNNRRGARAGLDGVHAQLRAREEEKRNHDVVRRLLDEAGNNTIFTLIVMPACGAMGPSMVALGR
jgi:hypothetical protein